MMAFLVHSATRWAGRSVTDIIRGLQLLVTECQAHVSASSCAVVLGVKREKLSKLFLREA